MRNGDSYQDRLTGGRASPDGWAAGGQRPPAAPQPGVPQGRRGGLAGEGRDGGCPSAGGAMTTTSTPARSATAPARPWLAVIREVAGDRVDRIVFAAVAAVAGFGYSVLLPFD